MLQRLLAAITFALFTALVAAVAGCEDQSPAEEAMEDIGEGAEEAGEEMEDAAEELE